MNHRENDHDHRIRTALEDAGAVWSRRSAGSQEGHLRTAEGTPLSARWDNDWLTLWFRADPTREAMKPRASWAWLASGQLPTRLKPVCSEAGDLGLRTDVMLDTDNRIGMRVTEAFREYDGWHARGRAPEATAAETSVDEERLAELLGAGAWSWRRRPGGRLTVDLHSPEFQGLAALDGRDGGVRVAAEICRWPVLNGASHEAVAWLLLRASDELRLVRPLLRDAAGEVVAEFLHVFTGEPNEADLHAVLSVLQLSGQLCCEPLRALGDETLAGRFLAIRDCEGSLKPETRMNERIQDD